ncbi:SGNH/GDSL hydrolase family protein [Schumannella sp. 10F1B-5-1]|uniref:SGNH/GDSL hydrolase family protein n=1 Tax=Schumannella sp. 10F1B-5-1 TaxID=2590780 RepID=UPI0011315C6B|nr:SGNH/GDSL hydrolase family protein [Schumannella sp. 10F1B-5-1]TPW73463.1 SGNH/GDSL hydrolase family protein [Schumannella sp. 10F1B-5-1]
MDAPQPRPGPRTIRGVLPRVLLGVAVVTALSGCAAGAGGGGTGSGGSSGSATPATTATPDADGIIQHGAADAPLAAFYGDSYTIGTALADPRDRWASIVSAERGWREFNPSVNGLGFVNNRGDRDLPGEIIAVKPDIVFVTMGLNDNFSYDARGVAADDIRQAIDRDLDRLHDALPDARFIVVEPFWYTDDRPKSLGVIIGWVHEAADRIGADWVSGASHWMDDAAKRGVLADDYLHPNAAGHADFARRMDEALTKLGLPPDTTG